MFFIASKITLNNHYTKIDLDYGAPLPSCPAGVPNPNCPFPPYSAYSGQGQ